MEKSETLFKANLVTGLDDSFGIHVDINFNDFDIDDEEK